MKERTNEELIEENNFLRNIIDDLLSKNYDMCSAAGHDLDSYFKETYGEKLGWNLEG